MANYEKNLSKAELLAEALPYIQKFHGNTVVIKYGGHAMLDEDLKRKVMEDIVLLHSVGIKPVVVHGGGPGINAMLKKVGKESQFIRGLRITDQETMDIALMVLVGKVSTEVVTGLNIQGGKAVGISGTDAGLLQAVKKPLHFTDEAGHEEEVDLGYVGEVKLVDPGIIQSLIADGYIPVISPVAGSKSGETWNINADTAACEIAKALKADKFLLLTDVPGVLRDVSDPQSVIHYISEDEIPGLMEEGLITGGMIPKVEGCQDALKYGVGTAHIMDGHIPHAIILELFTNSGIGTMFFKEGYVINV